MRIVLPIFVLFYFTIATLNAQSVDHVLGDVIIQMTKDKTPDMAIQDLRDINGISTELTIEKQLSKPFNIWLLHFNYAKVSESLILDHLFRHDDVLEAQLNHLVFDRATTPDDPLFNNQWHWLNGNDADVDADLAWDLTTGGKTEIGDHEIVACVVEGGGADWNHPDLRANHWSNSQEIDNDGMDNDGNGYVDDVNGWNPNNNNDNIGAGGHGTQVSGMIGGVGNNSLGGTGINWDVKIMQVMLGGLGSVANPNEANVIEAYTYPYVMRKLYNETNGEQGAFVVVINSSWGLDTGNPDNAPLWCSFYDSLGVVGILSCGATTNQNLDIDEVGDLPTACPSDYMVSVARTGVNDNHAGGFGATLVDFGAPGISVLTASNGGGYSNTTGTSFASPLTAGVISLMYSAPCPRIGETALTEPGAVALAMKQAIIDGVDVVPALEGITLTGGRINAFNALNNILDVCSECPLPNTLNIATTLDTSVTLEWTSGDSALFTSVRWRPFGDTLWTLVDSVTMPYELTGLTACNAYELQIQDVCADTSSRFTDSFFFDSEGCCVTPDDIRAINISENSAEIIWSSIFAAQSYNVLFTSPAGEFLFEDVDSTSLMLSDLIPCEFYAIQLQTVCDTGLTAFSMPVEFRTLGCGNCIDLSYCLGAGSLDMESIERFSFAEFENVSDQGNGYNDFTNLDQIQVETFRAYDFEIERRLMSLPFGQNFQLYIDFNQDGDFNQSDELVFQTTSPITEIATGKVIFDGDTPVGSTRLRVVLSSPDSPTTDPCSSDFLGDVEDYCLRISTGTMPECLPPVALDVINIDTTSVTLSFGENEEAYSYIVQYREIGAADWNGIEIEGTSLNLTGLEECTAYEFQVEGICVGVSSGFSDVFQFMTECNVSNVNTIESVNDISIFPNPFTAELNIQLDLSGSEQMTLELYDVLGKVMITDTKTLFTGQQNWNVKIPFELGKGVYFLKIATKKGKIVRRLLKE